MLKIKKYNMSFIVKFATKWSDFDPNNHMRHTAYNDYAAEVRIRYFAENNFSIKKFSSIKNLVYIFVQIFSLLFK